MIYLVTYNYIPSRQTSLQPSLPPEVVEASRLGAIHNAIKQIATDWWHYMPHVWLIASNMTSADALFNALKQHYNLQPEDRLLIIRVHRDYQGWLPKDAWDWINKKNF